MNDLDPESTLTRELRSALHAYDYDADVDVDAVLAGVQAQVVSRPARPAGAVLAAAAVLALSVGVAAIAAAGRNPAREQTSVAGSARTSTNAANSPTQHRISGTDRAEHFPFVATWLPYGLNGSGVHMQNAASSLTIWTGANPGAGAYVRIELADPAALAQLNGTGQAPVTSSNAPGSVALRQAVRTNDGRLLCAVTRGPWLLITARESPQRPANTATLVRIAQGLASASRTPLATPTSAPTVMTPSPAPSNITSAGPRPATTTAVSGGPSSP